MKHVHQHADKYNFAWNSVNVHNAVFMHFLKILAKSVKDIIKCISWWWHVKLLISLQKKKISRGSK